MGVDGDMTRVDSTPIPCPTGGQEQTKTSSTPPPTTNIGECRTASVCVSLAIISGVVMKRCVCVMCEALLSHEEELNALDRASGDGDCGSTLRAGAEGGYGTILVSSLYPPLQLFNLLYHR